MYISFRAGLSLSSELGAGLNTRRPISGTGHDEVVHLHLCWDLLVPSVGLSSGTRGEAAAGGEKQTES